MSTSGSWRWYPRPTPLAGRAELNASELSTTGLLTWPHQINSGLCDRLLAAFRIGGAGLRIIPLTGPSTTVDQVVLTPVEPSDTATALRDLRLYASAESPSPAR
ncbi:hypothetical protein ACH4E7_12790 [Kitasatospora sp. NPDC018058]|uniref:hypothetical protein n=1 Tax=Kitasatospora sp. NPDC018058 TaxID=3364025 RepID=UPI0037C16268